MYEEMGHAIDRLSDLIQKKDNPTAAGLDPRLDFIPPSLLAEAMEAHGETLRAAAAATLSFNRALIDALADIVPAVKLQSACYECLGPDGLVVMRETISKAKACGLFVILDIKRGDIGSTAEAYSAAYLGTVRVGSAEIAPYDADAITVNPYLGSDGILPFVEDCRARNRVIFVLCRTSNPSSKELQMLPAPDEPLYRKVGELCRRWGAGLMGNCGYSAVGLVAGVTHPAEIIALRKQLPDVFFLLPGYGAQGGTAEDAAHAFDVRGGGALVNASRSLLCAWKKTGDPARFAEAARAEALRMRDELRRAAR